MTVILSLPWPRGATVNHQYQRTARGVYLTERARAWREEVVLLVRTSGQTLPDGDLSVRLTLWQPDRRRQDIDNVLKSICDAVLVHGYGTDDSRIARLEVERFRRCLDTTGKIRSGVEVGITSWGGAYLERAMQTKTGEVERVLGRREE